MHILKIKSSAIATAVKNYPLSFFCFLFSAMLHLALLIFIQLRPGITHQAHRQKLTVNTHLVPSSSFSTPIKKPTHLKPSSAQSTKTHASLAYEKKPTQKVVKTPAKKMQKGSLTQQLSNEQAKQLLQQLQKSLAEIESKKETSQHNQMVVPQSIKELRADDYRITSEIAEESLGNYHSQLICFLKDALQLPAYGTVKVILTLSNKGEYIHLEILSSDSEVNRFYLEKQLKELQYPIFTKDISHTSTYSFHLTFCSDQ